MRNCSQTLAQIYAKVEADFNKITAKGTKEDPYTESEMGTILHAVGTGYLTNSYVLKQGKLYQILPFIHDSIALKEVT